MRTDMTLRNVWEWLTTDAWIKLQIIRQMPLDAPVSYWAHVLAAGFLWGLAIAEG